jgi:ABC-type transporter Mla maintaining outer membrane lipid asymmetry permease subunit MlaE
MTGLPGTVIAPYRRVAAISTGLGAGFGVFLGVAQTLQFGTGLGRFGGLTYVPRVVVLTTVRALGAGAAMLVTSVSTAIVLHQIGRSTPDVTVARDRRTLWLGAGTAATFFVVCALATLSGALTSAGMFGTGVRAFLGEARRTLTLLDVVHGGALAAVDAVIVTVLLPLVSSWMTAPRRGLLVKLFVAYATVQATAIVEQTLLALL